MTQQSKKNNKQNSKNKKKNKKNKKNKKIIKRLKDWINLQQQSQNIINYFWMYDMIYIECEWKYEKNYCWKLILNLKSLYN